MVDAVDVLAEQAAGQAMQRRTSCAGLVGRDQVAGEKGFIDGPVAPGSTQEVSIDRWQGEPAIERPAPRPGAEQRVQPSEKLLSDAALIVEVLSDSTAMTDRREKRAACQRLSCLSADWRGPAYTGTDLS
jgi:hypothetical protein